MNMLKGMATAMALGALMGTASMATAETLKISHVRPQGTAIDKDAKWFAEEVKKATNGEIEIEVHGANALGDYSVVHEMVSLGAVDMAVQPPAPGTDKRFMIVYFPYLTTDWDQARTTFAAGSPLRKSIAGLYQEQDIKVLAAWPVYFGGIALNEEINNAADLDLAKGKKVRVPGIKSFQMLAEELGFIPSPIPFSDAFTAMQTGVVDGVVGSGAEGYYASFRDLTKYYIPINSHFEVWYLIINNEKYESLSDDSKAALAKLSQEFEARRWKTAEADQAANEKRLAEYGAKIAPVSDDQRAAIAKRIREKVWPEVVGDVGEDWAGPTLKAIMNQ